MLAWGSIAVGLVILTFGADLLVRGASAIARRIGLSELLIGLTLVGFGTSTPELVSSIEAARTGAPGMALGNVVGSNIANILLILGLTALLAPVEVEPKSFRRDAPALAAATVAAIAFAMTGAFGRVPGIAFLTALFVYIGLAYATERRAPTAAETLRHEREAAVLPSASGNLVMSIMSALAGLAFLIIGARFLVAGAFDVAAGLGVSDALIGLTVVAVGTSLPELATSVAAAMRGKSDLALGNIVGSNLYNILGILGATALAAPIVVDARIAAFDLWVMLGATAVLILFARTAHCVNRVEGALLTAGYVVYLGTLVATA